MTPISRGALDGFLWCGGDFFQCGMEPGPVGLPCSGKGVMEH